MKRVRACPHSDNIRAVTPSALGCEECLKSGLRWVHLRLCHTCGYVGCCDSSPNQHATKHFHATGHQVIASSLVAEPAVSATYTTAAPFFVSMTVVFQQFRHRVEITGKEAVSRAMCIH